MLMVERARDKLISENIKYTEEGIVRNDNVLGAGEVNDLKEFLRRRNVLMNERMERNRHSFDKAEKSVIRGAKEMLESTTTAARSRLLGQLGVGVINRERNEEVIKSERGSLLQNQERMKRHNLRSNSLAYHPQSYLFYTLGFPAVFVDYPDYWKAYLDFWNKHMFTGPHSQLRKQNSRWHFGKHPNTNKWNAKGHDHFHGDEEEDLGNYEYEEEEDEHVHLRDHDYFEDVSNKKKSVKVHAKTSTTAKSIPEKAFLAPKKNSPLSHWLEHVYPPWPLKNNMGKKGY